MDITGDFFNEICQNPDTPNIKQMPGMPNNPPSTIPKGMPNQCGFIVSKNSTKVEGGKLYICNIDYVVKQTTPFFNLIHKLYSATEKDVFIINIYTYGGLVETGINIINAIKNTKAKVITVALGICASIGAMIWSCGHQRCVSNNATLMFHMPSGGCVGKAADNEEESRHTQEYFAQFMREITTGILSQEDLDKVINKRNDIFIPADVVNQRLQALKQGGVQQ